MHSNINIFSINSGNYKKFRPSYPKELFEYLASISPSTNTAWDAGCGSGQASIAISDYFTNVIATDVSSDQIKKAYRKENVRYLSCPSEYSNLDNDSIDLILCAQSIHWFDLKKFYNEVTRVLKPQGILAAWTYNLLRINEEIDNLIDKFYYDIIYNYWPAERKHVENSYKDINLPFKRIETPSFSITADWKYEQLIGYLNSWTGVLNYIETEAFNPIEFIEKDLLKLWGKDNNEFKSISWPLTLIIGRMN